MLTYYDSTDQKLPFLVKNFNIVNPNSWNVVSSGYNDASTLSAPLPKVQVSYGQNKGANVWTKELGGGIGASMFDAPYSTYTGIQDDNKGNHEISCRAFPNPCNQSITFDFTINRAQKVTIKLFNLLGQESGVISARVLPTGQQQLKADVSRFNPGSYIYTLMAEDYSYSGKLWIIR